MAGKKRCNRKKAVVNPRVQWTLALRVVLHFFIFICAGAVLGLINQFLMNPLDGAAEAAGRFLRNSAPILIAMVCLMPVFIRDTLTLSNRIAGPIHNLRNTMRRISAGEPDVPPLKFRKKDMWDGLADEFNTLVSTLKQAPSAQHHDAAENATSNTADTTAAPCEQLVTT